VPLQLVVTQVGDIAAPRLLAATLGACAATDEPPREPGPVPGSVPMTAPAEVRHVSVSIDRSPADVHAFCADPHDLPRWAAGLAASVRPVSLPRISSATPRPRRATWRR
jgi:hypothetical protein